MKDIKISTFMLERFRLGELSPDEDLTIRKTLAGNEGLRTSLEELDRSDAELRSFYPYKNLNLPKNRSFNTAPVIGIAAIIAVCILLPVMFLGRDVPSDRIKGIIPAGAELSVYLKGDSEAPLADLTMLREGNTVQLAYTAPAGSDNFGVIFSIDGRSEVTMHYPYRREQSSLLVSGRKIFLNEAYTLDDAPGYEVFIMVISGEPLATDRVLEDAAILAGILKNQYPGQAAQNTYLKEKSEGIFENCEIALVTILKE